MLNWSPFLKYHPLHDSVPFLCSSSLLWAGIQLFKGEEPCSLISNFLEISLVSETKQGLTYCGRQKNVYYIICPPKDVHIIIPRTLWICFLLGNRDFAGVIKLRILRWGDYPGLPAWGPSIITMVLIKGRQGAEGNREKKEMWPQNQLLGQRALKIEKGPKPRNAIDLWKRKQARKRLLPWSFPAETQPFQHLDFRLLTTKIVKE